MERIFVAILAAFTLDCIGEHFDRLCSDEVRFGNGPERFFWLVIMLFWAIAFCGQVVWLRELFLDL